MRLRFDRPFFKEFTLQVPRRRAGACWRRLLDAGYHAGLPLGRWYPALDDCLSVAVTEKRTRAEIDGLAVGARRAVSRRARRSDDLWLATSHRYAASR